MKKFVLAAVVALAATAAPAYAQDGGAEVYVGATLGYHDVDVVDDGMIYGGVVGVDVPLAGRVVTGLEANYNLGTGVIDSEYGVAAKLGYNFSDRGQIFVRGGYQEINFDASKVAGGPVPAGTDDTDGGWLLGVGAQYRVAGSATLRLNVDTIEFDSTRVTAGVLVGF
jgi:opacity protein-like surface antigen